MKPTPESDRLFLAHISECLERIEEYVGNDRQGFFESRMVQDAVIRNLQTLAESTQRLRESTKSTEPGIPWKEIARFRNVLAHDYIALDLEQIWKVIESELKPLAGAVDRMAERVRRESSS